MKASFVDLRKKSAEIIRALERNERITILYRGRAKAIMQPLPEQATAARVQDHPAFGLWKDRRDLQDVADHVRQLRKGRVRGL